MTIGQWFQNNYLITPQAAVFINDTGLSTQTLTGSGDLCIIGPSSGGQPNTPLYFVTPQDAINALIAGDGLRACLRAFSPAPDFPGAPRIIFVRASSATQATFTLQDASGANSIVLTSKDWGAYTNLIRVQVNAGTTQGRKYTVYLNTNTVVKDNITLAGLSITYTGTNPGPTYTVGPVSVSPTSTTASAPITANIATQSVAVGSSTAFTIGNQVIVGYQGTTTAEVVTITAIADGTHISGVFSKNHSTGEPIVLYNGQTGVAVNSKTAGNVDVPAEDVILPFTQFPTIQSVADALNARVGLYTAAILDPNPQDPSSGLDPTANAVTFTGSPLKVQLQMDIFAGVKALSDAFQPFVTAVAAPGALQPPKIETVGTWHYLAGGSDGNTPPLVSDWQAALNAAATIDCSVICVATGSSTVHAMLQTHVDFESSMNERHERIAVIGGVQGENLSQVQTRANGLRDPRIGLVWPGILDVDITQAQNGVIIIDPWLVAAQLGGMFCGGRIQDALTARYIVAKGVEQRLSNSDRDTLQVSGIIPIQYVQNKGYRVVHSLSTWTADQNFRKTELSVMRAADFLAKTLRLTLDSLVGQIVSPSLLARVATTTQSVLIDLQNQGVIVGDQQNPAFRAIQVTGSGDVVTVSFQAAPAIPANYILITAALFPYTGSVSI